MGKSIISILEVAAIVAVQFIPGIGQAVGVALGVSAAVGTAIAVAAVVTTEAILNATVLAPRSPKPATTERAVRQAIPPRVSAYGRRRLYGAYALFDTAPDGSAVDVYVFHDGQIHQVIAYWIGETRVGLLPNGFVQGQANNLFGGSDVVQVGTSLGHSTETAFATVISRIPDHWTSAHRGDGVVAGYMISRPVKSKNYQAVYATGGPNQTPLSIAIEAQLVFDWRDPSQNVADPTSWKWSENAVLHLAHYLLVRMNRSWALHFVPTLALWTAAANDADVTMALTGIQTTVSGDVNPGATSAPVFTINGLRVGMTISIFVSGDNSKTEVRTVTGFNGLYVEFSGGLSYHHPEGSQVTWASDPANPATEPRYRSCVTHAHTDAHKDVLAHLIGCFDGWLAPRSDGALVCYSGRYYTPTVTIGPDEIVSYSYQEGVAEEDAVNTIKVSYISAPHDYNTVDTDDWNDEASIGALGKVLSQTLENQVPSHSQARRLAKRSMVKVSAPYRGTVTTTAAGRIAIGQRYIRLQIIEAGTTFYDGPAEVQKLTRNLQTGGITFDWIAADPNVDTWNPATEEGNPAPVGNRIGSQPLPEPVVTDATPNYSEVSNDGTGVRITITVAGLNRDDVVWFARWRVRGDTVWNEQSYTDIDPSDAVVLVTGFVPTGKMIEVEAAYQVGDGRISDYSDPPTVVNTATDQTAPDPATAPTLVSWTASLNLTVAPIARASVYRWRFYKADGTTFIASHDTTERAIAYTSSMATSDGVQRAYVVKVSGVNAAGEGAAALSAVISNPAPAAVTNAAIAGGATTATATSDASADPDLAGYAVFYSASSGFDPTTSGGVVTSGAPSIPIYGLAAGTYYAHIAAFDPWTANPALLNLSAEISFTITTGGGSTPSGGGTGGGGYAGGGGNGHGQIP